MIMMRKLLFIAGTLLIVSAAFVFGMSVKGEIARLGFEWDTPWLFEQLISIVLASIWAAAAGAWCFCAASLTYPRVREKAAFLPVSGALIDLNVPSLVGDRELPDLEALRQEFGRDVNPVPGGE